MTVSTFDFGELFTVSARPIIAAAMKRGIGCHFDYSGGPSRIIGDAQTFQRGIYRLLFAAAQLLRAGSLILVADAANAAGEPRKSPDADGVELRIDAAASGERVGAAAVDDMLRHLDMTLDPASPADGGVITAHGICPVLGALLLYRCVPSAGALFSFSMRCAGEVLDDLRQPNAQGSAALVWHGPHQPAHDIGRRLQRLGWQVSLFDQRHLFEAALANHDALDARLVVVQEGASSAQDERLALPPAAPAPATCIHAVSAGSPALGVDGADGWDVRILPLLPSELWDLTRRATDDDGFHENSRPTPLPESARPQVLVVDDDEVNRIIASGLLQMIGYDAVSASSGSEAIALCQQAAPDAVLMDINMPGIDGYEASAALQRLQRQGSIPPFPIIAATAAGTPSQSAQYGLDGHLSKPLLAEDLRAQLQRALKGLATGL